MKPKRSLNLPPRFFWVFQIILVILIMVALVSSVQAAPSRQEPAPSPVPEETQVLPEQPANTSLPTNTTNPEPTVVPTENPPEPTVVLTEPVLEPTAVPSDVPSEPPSAGLANPSSISTAADGTVSINYVKPVRVYARNTYEPYILPSSLPLGAPRIAPISIIYRTAGQTNALGDTCLTFPTAAKTAFTYAASQWRARLTSAVMISIEACWANLPSGVLGHSAAMGYSANFPGAPKTNTWYPRALADKLRGANINPGAFDMTIAYANGFSSQFYYNPTGSPGTKYDFVEIVMHEIAHGLGFSASMRYSAPNGSWGYWDGSYTYLYPAIYDRFLVDSAYRYLVNTAVYPNPSSTLGSRLRSNAVYFNGAFAKGAYANKLVPLYAPGTWAAGSSISHLGEIFNTTTSKMMTYSIPKGEAVHDPGPVTKGILRDEGWGVVQ